MNIKRFAEISIVCQLAFPYNFRGDIQPLSSRFITTPLTPPPPNEKKQSHIQVFQSVTQLHPGSFGESRKQPEKVEASHVIITKKGNQRNFPEVCSHQNETDLELICNQ